MSIKENVDIVVSETGSEAAAQGIAHVGTAAEKTATSTQELARVVRDVRDLFVAWRVIEFARDLIAMSDAFSTMTARLGAVTSGTENLITVQQNLFELSEKTRTSFEANADFYIHVADEADHLGISQKDLIDLTRLLNESFVA